MSEVKEDQPAVVPEDLKGMVTRRAKAVALRKGIAYRTIKGTGRGGIVIVEDIRSILKETGKSTESVYDSSRPDEIRKMTVMQQTICRSMMESIHGKAQTTISTEADITSLVSLYKSLKGKYKAAGIKLSYTAMIIKAAAMALEDHPDMRAMISSGHEMRITEKIDIACAVDIPGGLIVPVIRNANEKSLYQICNDLADLSEKARSNKLIETDLGGACFTVTNLGMYNITYFTPVLNAPEGVILGVGSIFEKALASDNVMRRRSIMNMSLTHDHRVINGAPAARFLQEIVEGLQNFKWI